MERLWRRVVLLVYAAAMAVMLASCERASPSGDAGRDEGPRVVAMSPALAVMLRDLGMADTLVGRHGFDAWTDQQVPVCGDQAGVNVEVLLAVQPTHVLFQGEAPAEVVRLGERYGWTVRSWPLLTLDEVRACLADVADLFEQRIDPGRGEELLEAFDRAMAPGVPGGADEPGVAQPRVLLLLAVDPPAALGPGSFHHQMLERIGGRPAIDQGSPYMTLSAEDVLRIDADAIILFRPTESTGTAAAGRGGIEALGPLGRLELAAVRSGRVAVIDDPLGFVPGSNLIGLAEQMKMLLRQWVGAGGS